MNKVAGSYLVVAGLVGGLTSVLMLLGALSVAKDAPNEAGAGALLSGVGGAASAAMVWGGTALLNLTS
jgi:hypothetical protein